MSERISFDADLFHDSIKTMLTTAMENMKLKKEIERLKKESDPEVAAQFVARVVGGITFGDEASYAFRSALSKLGCSVVSIETQTKKNRKTKEKIQALEAEVERLKEAKKKESKSLRPIVEFKPDEFGNLCSSLRSQGYTLLSTVGYDAIVSAPKRYREEICRIDEENDSLHKHNAKLLEEKNELTKELSATKAEWRSLESIADEVLCVMRTKQGSDVGRRFITMLNVGGYLVVDGLQFGKLLDLNEENRSLKKEAEEAKKRSEELLGALSNVVGQRDTANELYDKQWKDHQETKKKVAALHEANSQLIEEKNWLKKELERVSAQGDREKHIIPFLRVLNANGISFVVSSYWDELTKELAATKTKLKELEKENGQLREHHAELVKKQNDDEYSYQVFQ